LSQKRDETPMKRRHLEPETSTDRAERSLCGALLACRTPDEMRAFLRDLCTPAELEALVDRWRVVPYLLRGMAYREIHERTSVSVTTIGRVARFLSQGNGGYQAAIAHHAIPQVRKRGRPAGAARKTASDKPAPDKRAPDKPAPDKRVLAKPAPVQR
jgi:TrpR-related protein YerC/YecD